MWAYLLASLYQKTSTTRRNSRLSSSKSSKDLLKKEADTARSKLARQKTEKESQVNGKVFETAKVATKLSRIKSYSGELSNETKKPYITRILYLKRPSLYCLTHFYKRVIMASEDDQDRSKYIMTLKR